MSGRLTLPVRVCDPHFRKFAGSPRGYVHSVYGKAVNIWDGEDLLAVVAGTCFAAPYTGNTDEGGFLEYPIHEGDVVEGRYPLIRVGSGLLLECGAAVVSGEKMRSPGSFLPESEAFSAGVSRYCGYLREHEIRKGCADFFRRYCAGEQLPDPGCLQAEINRRLFNLAQAAGEPERFAAAARRLVGAGMGLTPAGDDFLCGLLTALGSCERTFFMREILVKGLKGWSGLAATTAVSRQMLKAYLDGESSLLYRRLAGSFRDGGREMEEIMKLVEGIGHSSGIDFSAGMATGYCLIQTEFEMELG